MTKIVSYQNDPFTAFVRDFFNDNGFLSVNDVKTNYPIDQYIDDGGYHFKIALPGVGDINSVKISVENANELRVAYERPSEDIDEKTTYVMKRISRKSFKLGWIIPPKFDCSKISAKLQHGELSIDIPIAEEAKPRTIEIVVSE